MCPSLSRGCLCQGRNSAGWVVWSRGWGRGGIFAAGEAGTARAQPLCPQKQPPLLVQGRRALVWKQKMDGLFRSIDCHGWTGQLRHPGGWPLVDTHDLEHSATARGQVRLQPSPQQLWVLPSPWVSVTFPENVSSPEDFASLPLQPP